MKKNSLKYLLYVVLIVLMGVALISCGSSTDDNNGGGDTNTPNEASVTGVAATGAPVNGNVWLKDSTGTEIGPATIAHNGTFSFDVSGLTPPYYLKSVSTSGEVLYSVAMDEGTANINPLTNLAVAVAAGVSDPAMVYDDPASYPITQAALDQAIEDILAGLDPLFDGYDCRGQNPLTDPFEADGKKLDGFFDGVEIELVNGYVTFTDKDSGDAICKMSVPGMERTPVSVNGEGSALPISLKLDVNVLSLSGEVSGGYSATEVFGSTEITEVNVVENHDIVIKGSAICSDLLVAYYADCTFTVTLTDGDPDLLDLVLIESSSGAAIHSYSNVELTKGDFIVTY